jgi:hypothetical protein
MTVFEFFGVGSMLEMFLKTVPAGLIRSGDWALVDRRRLLIFVRHCEAVL